MTAKALARIALIEHQSVGGRWESEGFDGVYRTGVNPPCACTVCRLARLVRDGKGRE